MQDFSRLKEQLLTNRKTRDEYLQLEPQYAVIQQLLDLRLQHKLTQQQLAEKIGTKQSAIARLESGNANPSVELLQKIATALNAKLSIRFTPQ